eukprot:8656269-Prorocentrum_lima.AAC.1
MLTSVLKVADRHSLGLNMTLMHPRGPSGTAGTAKGAISVELLLSQRMANTIPGGQQHQEEQILELPFSPILSPGFA